jgi:LmbE family N-acetylglucosaminyl deacetylase
VKALLAHRHARVLAVVAHADDEALFCGGTLRRLRDQGCEIHIAVATDVAETNSPPVRTPEDVPRQHRRLVAFGRAAGMIDAERTYLFDAPNWRASTAEASREVMIRACVGTRLRPLLEEIRPVLVLSHGPLGEYGHRQHQLVADVVVKAWGGPLWRFDAEGPEAVPIDLAFKRRLLGCYRHGTTQAEYWSPYAAVPALSPVGPWLGEVERFRPR